MFIHHKVRDYASWKLIFDEHESTRREGGSKGVWLFQGADDADEVFLLLQWEDLDSARHFAASKDLRDARVQAGVVDDPEIYCLQEIDRTVA